MARENLKGHLALLTTNLIFGMNAPIAKQLLSEQNLNAYSLSLARMIGAALLFWITSLFTKREKVRRQDMVMLIFAGLLGVICNQFGFIIGLSKTSPIDALILETLVPIMTMIIAALYLKEPITFKKALGVAIGASGAVVLILSGQQHGTGLEGSTQGNLIVLLSGIGYALYFTIFRNLIKRYSPVTLMKWMFLFSAIICTPICYEDIQEVNLSAFTWSDYASIIYVICFSTFLAYMLLPVGQKRLRPTVVSMYIYGQPIVATILAVAMKMDRFGLEKIIASLLVFLGVYFVTQSKSREQMLSEKRKKIHREIANKQS